jgi:membrane protein
MKKAKRVLIRIWKIFKLEEMRILPGQLAFFMVLSVFDLFPIFGLLGSSFISNELINSMDHSLPAAVSSILKSLMEVESSGLSITLFIIFSIYIASTGCEAIIITSNVIYKIKNTMSIKQSIKAIFMTVILISLILFVVLVPAFGELIINAISKDSPGKVIDTIHLIYDVLKYPISFLLIFIDLKVLYTLAPNARIPSAYNNYGTLFTTIMWIIITRVYSIYLNNFNTYDIFYGSFGNVVIMLFWMYLLAYVFTMGLAINAEFYFKGQESVKKEEKVEENN